VAVEQFPIFRGLLDEMCAGPIFAGSRAERIQELIRPFDAHFEPLMVEARERAANDTTGQRGESPDTWDGMIG